MSDNTSTQVRLILGLSSDVVNDETLAAAVTLAEEWCAVRASAFGLDAPPSSSVVLMSLYFLRTHLDLAGIKPSSLTLPDLAMSTDFASASNMLKDTAVENMKALAFKKGKALRHIRSGRVGKWH